MSGPLSRPVDVRTLPAKGYTERIDASEREREALARASGVIAIPAFAADIRVVPWGDDGVRVTGAIDAAVVQECVVSLEPVEGTVSEAIDAVLVPEGSPLARVDEGEVMLDADSDDPPETFASPTIDIGALAAEFFTLGLDPYPRAPDATLPSEASDAAPNPFEALRALKGGA